MRVRSNAGRVAEQLRAAGIAEAAEAGLRVARADVAAELAAASPRDTGRLAGAWEVTDTGIVNGTPYASYQDLPTIDEAAVAARVDEAIQQVLP